MPTWSERLGSASEIIAAVNEFVAEDKTAADFVAAAERDTHLVAFVALRTRVAALGDEVASARASTPGTQASKASTLRIITAARGVLERYITRFEGFVAASDEDGDVSDGGIYGSSSDGSVVAAGSEAVVDVPLVSDVASAGLGSEEAPLGSGLAQEIAPISPSLARGASVVPAAQVGITQDDLRDALRGVGDDFAQRLQALTQVVTQRLTVLERSKPREQSGEQASRPSVAKERRARWRARRERRTQRRAGGRRRSSPTRGGGRGGGSGGGGESPEEEATMSSDDGSSSCDVGSEQGTHQGERPRNQPLLVTIRQVCKDLEPTLRYLPSGDSFKMVKFSKKHVMPHYVHIPRSDGYLFSRDAPRSHWEVPIPLQAEQYPIAWRNMADWLREDQEAKTWGGLDFVSLFRDMQDALLAVYRDEESLFTSLGGGRRASDAFRSMAGYSHGDQIRRCMGITLVLAGLIHHRATAGRTGPSADIRKFRDADRATRAKLVTALLHEAQPTASRATRRHRVCAKGRLIRNPEHMPVCFRLRPDPAGACLDSHILKASKRAPTSVTSRARRAKSAGLASKQREVGASADASPAPKGAHVAVQHDWTSRAARSKGPRCWNCQQLGHRASACPKPPKAKQNPSEAGSS